MTVLEIREVKTKKEQRDFVNFPLKLYKNNEYYVPMLYADEMKIFKPDYPFNKVCDVVFFLAYEGKTCVGRIQGIIQREANEKWGQKRVRFTRFDAIDDENVASALFSAVENWAKAKGMTEFVGPLGYSDLEREGLLIEGFEEKQTFEEQYNYPYYQKLIESCGFEKDVDWIECKLYAPEENGDKLIELSTKMLKRYELRTYQAPTVKELIDRYIDDIFDVIDKTYADLYGTMPLNKEIVDSYVESFKMIVRPEDVMVIIDKNEKLVGMALMFPSISEAVRSSNGHITLPFLVRFLKSKKHPKVLDLGLIGILPEYRSRGISTIMIGMLINLLKTGEVDHFETNLMLEDNYNIINSFKHFDRVQNKRRRCFKKSIAPDAPDADA